jgi:hypothetical protein
MAKVPPRRRNLTKQDVRWKLAEVRARQLADAISAARVPFFLALAWGFSWAFALYEAEFSYTHTYLTRYNYFQTLSSELKKVGPPENEELLREQMRLRVELAEFCNRILPSTQENPILERTYKLDQIVHETLCDNLIA